ncbi:MAG: hypothetical protein RIE77_04310 [Phycisphaerales bacterium]
MTDVILPAKPELHLLGTQLSERILDAEKRFEAISEKCDHFVVDRLDGCVSEDLLGPHRRGVGFKRDGKKWKLFFVEEGEHERERSEYEELLLGRFSSRRSQPVRQHYQHWEELSQCSLVQKSQAVKLLPKLLTEMRNEYQRRTKLVGEALSALDELDTKLPASQGEGK